jgi:hypothetical protein
MKYDIPRIFFAVTQNMRTQVPPVRQTLKGYKFPGASVAIDHDRKRLGSHENHMCQVVTLGFQRNNRFSYALC